MAGKRPSKKGICFGFGIEPLVLLSCLVKHLRTDEPIRTMETIIDMGCGETPSKKSAFKSPDIADGGFDLVPLLERVDGDDSLLREMARLFLKDLPGRISAIHRAIRHNSTKDLAEKAHSLKGSLGYFSTSRDIKLAQSLENAARRGRMEEAVEIFHTLESRVHRVENDLEAWLDTSGA